MVLSVIESIQNIHNFNQQEMISLGEKLTLKDLKKGKYLIKTGQVCNFIAFTNKGSLRYLNNIHGEEKTLHFFTENNWVADFKSYISQKPSENAIVALEDSELVVLSLKSFHELVNQFPNFKMLGKIMQNGFNIQSRFQSYTKKSPGDRCKALMDDHPDWIQRFPPKYIASYLGISAETLNLVLARLA